MSRTTAQLVLFIAGAVLIGIGLKLSIDECMWEGGVLAFLGGMGIGAGFYNLVFRS